MRNHKNFDGTVDTDSIPIFSNVPVVFYKAGFMKWFDKNEDTYKFGLAFNFEHEPTGNLLVHKVFQPSVRDYTKDFMNLYHKKREMAAVLGEILNTLAGQDLTSEIVDLGKQSWDMFYTQYISRINDFRMSGSKSGLNKKLYIKTLVRPIKDGLYTACLAERNFISLEPNLEYTVLEENQVEDFIEDIDGMIPSPVQQIMEKTKPKPSKLGLNIEVPF